MWAIIKIDKKKINLFKKDFSKFFDSNLKIYTPKIKIKNTKKNKLKLTREIPILGDYILKIVSSQIIIFFCICLT